MNFTELIKDTTEKIPSQVAFHSAMGTRTFKSMWEEVEEKAEELRAYGVKVGQGIGVMGQNSVGFVTSILAVMNVGAVVLPISHNLKSDEVKKLCSRTKLHFLWDDKSSDIPSINSNLNSTELAGWRWTINESASHEVRLAKNVDDAALIRFTSGTTGKSKGVILSHQSIKERTESANAVLQLGETDVVMWVLSMAYHFVVSILLYLRYGCSICICESFMGDHILERTNELKGTFLYVSPMHVRMLNKESSGRQMPTLKRVISTSMAISADLCDAFSEKYNLPITQAFGIIEIGLPVINTREAGSEPAAIGFPLPAYDVEILSDEGVPVDEMTVGQLAIRGPGMFDAYLDPPMSRAEAMDFGFFLTGDLASRSTDGRITIVGRKKNVINVSGNKAFPEEIETIINQYEGVENCRVKGFQHPLLSECVMAEVVRKPGAEVGVEALISFCRKRLSTYKVPQRIQFVDALDMTDSGKIRRV